MTRKQFFLSILGVAAAPVSVKAVAPKPLTISTNVGAAGEYVNLDFMWERYGKPSVELQLREFDQFIVKPTWPPAQSDPQA
jgi:hypothetical protein